MKAIESGEFLANCYEDSFIKQMNEFSKNIAEGQGKNQMDAADDVDGWSDQGVQTENAKAKVHSTPQAESMPDLGGYEAHTADARQKDKGFDRHDGPSASIFTSDQPDFTIKKEDVVKTYTHPKFGKFYKMKDGAVYSKDRAGHGGSAWKQFRDTAKGFEWKYDLDAKGEEIKFKHKGSTGKFIPKSELSANGGGK